VASQVQADLELAKELRPCFDVSYILVSALTAIDFARPRSPASFASLLYIWLAGVHVPLAFVLVLVLVELVFGPCLPAGSCKTCKYMRESHRYKKGSQ
jgi:hypothetical protein